MVGIQSLLQFHVVELLLKTIDPTSLNGLSELSVPSLLEAQALEPVGQLPVRPSELVEHVLWMAPWVVRLGRLHRHL